MCGSVRVGQSGLAAAVTYLPLAPIPVRLIGIPGPWSNPGSCHSILGNSMPVSPICSNPSCIINVNFLTFPAAFRYCDSGLDGPPLSGSVLSVPPEKIMYCALLCSSLVLLSSSYSHYPLLMANVKPSLPKRHLAPLFCALANSVSLLGIYMAVSALERHSTK